MATIPGKVRSLYVRPIQSADLAFEFPGIIAFQGKGSDTHPLTLLGKEVKALILEQTIYPLLSKTLEDLQNCDKITDQVKKRNVLRK